MRYSPVTCGQRDAMLEVVGVANVDDLFADIPAACRLDRLLDIPAGLGEIELSAHLKTLARRSHGAEALMCLAGAGVYDHHIPAAVDAVISKPEFFTAYTPYQAEVSQGTLQAIYEFQSMIRALTGMDVANASMYDGATALVEAALMACRVTRRHNVVVAGTLHPEWQETLATYARGGHLDLTFVAPIAGRVEAGTVGDDAADGSIAAQLTTNTACVVLASPNVFGALEDLEAIGAAAHAVGAMLVVATNPILLGVMEPPSAFGADIVVGEGQPLGNAMSFGGPGLGFFACREQHIRQMPGRLVGRTLDADGNDGFVLTLSTREQHIRREKATSNICSNHALNALAAGVYLAALGPVGLEEVATASVAKAHYLRDRLLSTGRFSAPWDVPFGYEFTLRFDGDVPALRFGMLARGFIAGVSAAELAAGLPDGASIGDVDGLVVFAVTEKRTRAELDAFVEEVASW